MPRDTSFQTRPDADELTLEQRFAVWVGKQPSDEAYDYFDSSGCAIVRFLKADTGAVRYDDYAAVERETSPAAIDKPWTFGALATRLAKQGL